MDVLLPCHSREREQGPNPPPPLPCCARPMFPPLGLCPGSALGLELSFPACRSTSQLAGIFTLPVQMLHLPLNPSCLPQGEGISSPLDYCFLFHFDLLNKHVLATIRQQLFQEPDKKSSV